MKWLDETRGPKFELIRHFLARMFDSEMFSTRGQWQTVAIGAFALAIPARLLLMKAPYLPKRIIPSPETIRTGAIAQQLGMLTFVFAVTGVLALLAWQSLFPSRRDYLALAGLPVRSRQIFAARFASVALLGFAITIALIFLPSFSGPHVLARALSSGLGCLFIFFAIVAIQGVLINATPARLFTRYSTYVQAALVALFFLSGLYSWFVADWGPQMIKRLPDFGAWAPPVWFMGLEQTIAGKPDPFLRAMAARGLIAAAGSVVLAGLMYLLAYSRYQKLLLESLDGTARRRAWRWSLLQLIAPEPRQQAIVHFLAKSLSRSRTHRLVLLAYLGAALGILINSVLLAGPLLSTAAATLRFVCLFWPVATSFIVLAGIRHAFSMPVEWPANWLFRITESQGRREWMSAVERFVIFCVVAPIHAVTFLLAVGVLGLPVAVRMTALQLLVSLVAFEVLFYSWQQLPFTCSYVPGKRPLVSLVATWIAVLGVPAPLLSRFIAAMSQETALFLTYGGAFAAAWLGARRLRREGWGESRLIFEDRHDAVPDLGIKEMTYRRTEWQRELPSSPKHDDDVAHALVRAASRLIATHGAPVEHRALSAHEAPGAGTSAGAARTSACATGLWQDVRYGLRMLARAPGFTTVALISLGLGIGIATSAFSMMNGYFLRDVPGVTKPGGLFTLEAPASYPNYKRYREQTGLFSSIFAYVAPAPFGVSLGHRTERTWGHLVTPSYFDTLGVRPLLGRVFDEQEEQPGRTPTVVISHQFWQNHLGSDSAVIGKTLQVNGHACTVIGITPKDFQGASPLVYLADLWLPVSVGGRVAPELAENALERRDLAIFHVTGRLQPGVPAPRAQAALDAVARQIEQEHGDPDRDQKGRRVSLLPAGKLIPIRKQDLPFLTGYFTLLGGMILLIASSNVANMMLARAADRRREIAVRLALGAGRARLIRQLLTESMLVGAAAGVLGFLMATWLTRGSSQLRMPYPMPLTFHFEPDWRVLIFTVVLSAFTGLAFGLAPALQATRTGLTTALKEGGDVRFGRHRRLSLRNMLVLSQVAGSLALLLITGFLVIGHQKMAGVETGFDPRNLQLISLDPMRDGYSGVQTANFFEKLLDRVKTLPSVTAASLADSTPMAMIGKPSVNFSVAGAGGEKVIRSGRKYVVGRDFFDTIGIPILRGRGFRKQDEANDATAAIVSEKLARVCWNGADPLGRRIEIGAAEVPRFAVTGGARGPGARGPRMTGKIQTFEVVGVAKDVRDGLVMVAADGPPLIYVPLRQADYERPALQGWTLAVRTMPGVDSSGAVRREISSLDDNLTPFNARSMPEQIEQMMFPVRMALWTYGCIGVFGLILASVGLAGVTAYAVTQRRREIGIRMALGARKTDVLGLVMKEGAVLVTVGTIIGLAGARAGMRLLSAFMSQVARSAGTSTSDPLLLVAAPLLLAALALVACYVPARKSMRIDPAVALRQE